MTLLRELTREGVLGVTCVGVAAAEVALALKESTEGPHHRVVRLPDLHPAGGIAAVLGTQLGDLADPPGG